MKCGIHTWQLHRSILCGQSQFLERLCDGFFREAQEQCVTFEDEDPLIVAQALHFMYFGKFGYEEDKALKSSWATGQFVGVKDTLGLHEHTAPSVKNGYIYTLLYAFGDKYLASGLKRKSYDAFRKLHYSKLQFTVKPVSEDVKSTLSRVGPQWLETHKDHIRIVYTSTPDSDRWLRDVIVLTYHEWNRLFAIRQSKAMEELVYDCPAFAWDVISKPSSAHVYYCENCHNSMRVLGNRDCHCSIPGHCTPDQCEDHNLETLNCYFCLKVGGLVSSSQRYTSMNSLFMA